MLYPTPRRLLAHMAKLTKYQTTQSTGHAIFPNYPPVKIQTMWPFPKETMGCSTSMLVCRREKVLNYPFPRCARYFNIVGLPRGPLTP